MLAYEHFRPQQYLQQHFDVETNAIEPYPAHTMASFDFNTAAYNAVSYTYCDAPAMYAEAPCNDNYQMVRSFSSGSEKRSIHDKPPTLLSSASVHSATSSSVGSPFLGHAHTVSCEDMNSVSVQPYLSAPTILDENYHSEYSHSHLTSDFFIDHEHKLPITTFVDIDPNLISARDPYYQYSTSANSAHPSQPAHTYSPVPSPVPSQCFGQFVTSDSYSRPPQRRMSMSSQRSGNSSRASVSSDEENGEKGRCPHPDCGRVFKDLKAHMLTHRAVRPEKCPIPNCEYYQKGFARRYDKNRHTLTHYKGTMICGFCPGSGSAAEKSFNRADVFKRHLTQVHGVEQNPPNSRKRSPSSSNKKLASYCPDATGKCSTCSNKFNNAQEFYEHLDECVLRVVQQEDPGEAINALRLAEVEMDADVQDTFDRHMIKKEEDFSPLEDEEEDEDEDLDECEDEDGMLSNDKFGKTLVKTARAAGARVIIGGGITKNTKSGKKGMTWSKGGVSLVSKSRKRRKHYPSSWGLPADKMRMKKRVLCVYDGSRRLLKDDMMLHNEHEVRMPIPDSDFYVTDLDMETLKRANAFHDATEEEKGDWNPQPDFLSDLMS